ncbi:Hsp20/alpha crystallin family protein [Halobacillus sp. ACCC02827]|uniref:Hsp20/alpha crystallin family protein n=1 Tax=Bacillaceae TaxID=186817 RepID=UPI001F3637C0|nr:MULTISPECIES: Hsp20/alpha crystallin family protein [Bacillaceae]WJE16826.1 Hsp20/alpha crystallin family protein [Halobacillus sp. ACCC02827]
MDRLKEWLDVAQQYQTSTFWGHIFEKANLDQAEDLVNIQNRGGSSPSSYPAADVFMTDTHVIIFVEMPGVRKEDIQLSGSGSNLSIKGQVNLPIEGAVPVQQERALGPFEKTIPLPDTIDNKQVKATFINGLMMLNYPRSPDTHRNITIE